jgi:hypothetical protein
LLEKSKGISPRIRRGLIISRQIKLLISGDRYLTHATQHGSCYSEIGGDRFIGKNEQSLDRLITLIYWVKCKLLIHNNDELLENENLSFARR